MGGRWYTKKYDYFGMPLYAKPRSIIVYGNFRGTADYDYFDCVKIVIYGMDEGCTAETVVYDSSCSKKMEIRAVSKGDCIELTVRGADHPFTAESSQGLDIVIID